ncbi:MAG: hypothetical protein PHH54_05290 [Candidatus Nanoarchaeia archaeon]|nr:hypothetical protein [Candidatus Nanoarchaeia archaeon]MDD5741372.1 hypothetical protein [Candidatus Nanoarchaeia archaeon]
MSKIFLIDDPLDSSKFYEEGYRVAVGEPKRAGDIASIYTSKAQVDNYWLVRIARPRIPYKIEIIGVTSHEENISDKTYEKALEYAKSIAQDKGIELSNLTKRGKSKLEQLAQPQLDPNSLGLGRCQNNYLMGRCQRPVHQRGSMVVNVDQEEDETDKVQGPCDWNF